MTESVSEAVMPLMPTSPGALIKAGRERAGVHMAVLSVNLKVTVKQLEALEADQYDFLSGPVFARALASKVCRFLKMDPQPVLALMPATTNGLKPLNIIGADQAPAYSSHQTSSHGAVMGRGLKLGLLVLLLALLTLIFGANWFVSVLRLDNGSDAAEVVPTMPPVQEPVTPDASQADLPKALVFDGATTPNNVTTPAAQPAAANTPAETHK